MSDDLDAHQKLFNKLAQNPLFRPVYCCGQRIGLYNSQPFNDDARAKLEAIREALVTAEDPHGNAWTEDTDAREIVNDPSSYTVLPEGYRFSFRCPFCKSSFVMAGGEPMRLAREVA